jgi:hypothetical protein
MKNYISILVTITCMISCDNDEETLTSDNAFTLDGVKYETRYCFFEDEGIEAGNRDLRKYGIQLVSNEHDGAPFVLDNPNSQVITFTLLSPSLTELKSGEYIQSAAIDNTLCSKDWKPGEYFGIAVGIKLNDEANKKVIICINGKITVKKLADNEYYLSYSGTCDNGMSLTGSFKGSPTFLDHKQWGCWDD